MNVLFVEEYLGSKCNSSRVIVPAHCCVVPPNKDTKLPRHLYHCHPWFLANRSQLHTACHFMSFQAVVFGRTKSSKTGCFLVPTSVYRKTRNVVANCCLLPPSSPSRASDLLKVEVLRLDWQRLSSIQNLDIFTHLRELYLQYNRIQVVEELDTLRSLEFLALGSNRIRRLENLRHLSKVSLPNCGPPKYWGRG